MASSRRSVSWAQRVINTANEKIGEKLRELSVFRGSSYREVRKMEGSRNRNSSVHCWAYTLLWVISFAPYHLMLED